jgi:very-short-patch-repair endonuclease
VTEEKLIRAKQLRREMTQAEALLWHELRANKLGVHFRRQQIIAGYIVDFYCHSASLVVEVDGAVHANSDQQSQDARRDEVLKGMGLNVLHIRNSEVESDMPRVLARLRELIAH